MSSVSGRRALWATAIAVAGLGSCAGVATPSQAATNPRLTNVGPHIPEGTWFQLWSSLATVHTSSGKRLRLQISIQGMMNSTAPSILIVSLTTGTISPCCLDVSTGWKQDTGTNPVSPLTAPTRESHLWFFHIQPIFPGESHLSGTASFSTGRKIQPFGSLKLKFTQRTAKQLPTTVLCHTGILYRGQLSGALDFKTRGNGWGTVNPYKSVTFPKGTWAAVTNPKPVGCRLPPPPGFRTYPPQTGTPPCYSGITWVSPVADEGFSNGFFGLYLGQWFVGQSVRVAFPGRPRPPVTTINAFRSTQLSKPAGAVREDALTEVTGSQTYDSAANVLSITAGDAGSPGFTGASTISNPAPSALGGFSDCAAGPEALTQQAADDTQLAWTNSGAPLTASFSVGSAFSADNNTTSALVRWSWVSKVPPRG
jgi:hypothetical protein